MSDEPIDRFAADQSEERRSSVRGGAIAGHEARARVVESDYAEFDRLRALAGRIKQHALDHLDRYLLAGTAALESHGARSVKCGEYRIAIAAGHSPILFQSRLTCLDAVAEKSALASRVLFTD